MPQLNDGAPRRTAQHDQDGRIVRRGVRQHEAELVPTETVDAVHAAESLSQGVDEEHQLPVPSRVARGVVDSLEAVEIDRDDGQVELGTCATGQLSVDVPFEGAPVGTSGQWVAESCPLELVSGSTTGVDHREVNQSDDRLLSRSYRDQAAELHELFDHENGQANASSPPCRGRGKNAPALDLDCRAGRVPRFDASCEVLTSGGLVAVAAIAEPGCPLGGLDCSNNREKPPAAVPSVFSSSSRSSASARPEAHR